MCNEVITINWPDFTICALFTPHISALRLHVDLYNFLLNQSYYISMITGYKMLEQRPFGCLSVYTLWVIIWYTPFGWLSVYTLWVFIWYTPFGCLSGIHPLGVYLVYTLWVFIWYTPFGCLSGIHPLGVYLAIDNIFGSGFWYFASVTNFRAMVPVFLQ